MRRSPLVLAFMLLAWSLPPATLGATVADAGAAREAARSVPAGGALVLTGVLDLFAGDAITLELVRFEVLAPGAHLVVHEGTGEEEARRRALPRSLHFRGAVAGRPDAVAFLALHEDGEMRGLVLAPGEVRMLGFGSAAARAAGRLESRLAVASELALREPFVCANPDEPGLAVSRALFPSAGPARMEAGAPPAVLESAAGEGAAHRVVYAVETDYEFYQLFDNLGLAAEYVTDVMAFVSALYGNEIDTDLLIGQVSLYSHAGDPWGQSSPTCSLFEFGRYWNDHRAAVDRDAAVMFSGKNNGGGVAWLGVICDGAFSYNAGSCPGLLPAVDNYGGGYAYVGTMDGNFDLGSPQLVWDILATAHEIGHNFNSPHSHCYGGILGNSSPVDGCYAGECGANCYCTQTPPPPAPPVGVPGIGTLIGGIPGTGTGTIMSYCHLRSGGNSNVTFSFGTGQIHGVAAGREATYMKSYVGSLGSCVADQAGALRFADGFETGTLLRWSSSQP
jgi:hypothetical protein